MFSVSYSSSMFVIGFGSGRCRVWVSVLFSVVKFYRRVSFSMKCIGVGRVVVIFFFGWLVGECGVDI